MTRKPPKTYANCENCDFSQGLPHPDEEDKEIIRIYCKVRHTPVNMRQMTKFCDFWTIKKAMEVTKPSEEEKKVEEI